MSWVKVEYAGGAEAWVNLDNVVGVSVTPGREPGRDEETGERIAGAPLTVEVETTAPVSRWDDGGDYPDRAHLEIRPHLLHFYGPEARRFMRRLEVLSGVGA